MSRLDCSGAVSAMALFVGCVCAGLMTGCQTNPPEFQALQTAPPAPEKFGVGTITVPTGEGQTLLLFTADGYGPKKSDLVLQGVVGSVDTKDSREATIRAAADILASFGLSANVATTVASNATIHTKAVTKRYLDGGAFLRFASLGKIDAEVIRQLRRPDTQIIVEDYVIEGLTVDVQKSAALDAAAQLKLDAASKNSSSLTGVTVGVKNESTYRLVSGGPVSTSLGPISCSAFLQKVGIDIDAAARASDAKNEADLTKALHEVERWEKAKVKLIGYDDGAFNKEKGKNEVWVSSETMGKGGEVISISRLDNFKSEKSKSGANDRWSSVRVFVDRPK